MENNQDVNAFEDSIIKIEEIAMHHNDVGLSEMANEVRYFKENYKIKVLFAGHFSAGKSALLNSLLERSNLLKEAQSPQTALATELWYTDGEESSYAVTLDGKKVPIDISSDSDTSEYTHAVSHINAPALSELKQYVLVDLLSNRYTKMTLTMSTSHNSFIKFTFHFFIFLQTSMSHIFQ